MRGPENRISKGPWGGLLWEPLPQRVQGFREERMESLKVASENPKPEAAAVQTDFALDKS